MKLRTVSDLKQYLQANSLSPERFSALCGISNMTVRRWVKNEGTFELPQKYWPLFDQVFHEKVTQAENLSHEFSFMDGFADLEKHVSGLGESAKPESVLREEFKEKTADKNIAQGLVEKIKLLFSALTSANLSAYQRTLVLGAIVYFISPIDLIPDVTPVVGYLDDYAVATMVLTSVTPALLSRKKDF